MEHLEQSLATTLTDIACKQIKVAFDFRQPRLDEIQKIEDLYFNKTKKPLKGRYNIPLPILGGFVDTLLSKTDDQPTLTFKPTTEADLLKAKKIQAAWELDKNRANWSRKDKQTKKLAILSGRGTQKIYAESDPEYRSVLEVIDYNDFLCEPMGGSDLENHLFLGQQGIFKTEHDLKGDAYNKEQVQKLATASSSEEGKVNEDLYKNKENRYQALGLDIDTNNYVGQKIFSLTEWCLEYEGIRYYLLLDYRTKLWVRAHKLKDVFSDNLYPFVSWATHEEAFNFWSKGACDDIRPTAEAIQIAFNRAFEAENKRIWGQRAYDPEVFKDPSQLEFRPDGLVLATPKPGKQIQDGIYEFKTPSATLTLNLIEFLKGFVSRETGVTAEAQGSSDQEKKVGVYYGDLKQISDRLGLYNKYYVETWKELGIRYITGLKDHCPEEIAIKMIGERGIKWDKLIKEDLDAEFDITVSSSSQDAQADEIKKKTKSDSLMYVSGHPIYQVKVNAKWAIENILKNGGWEEADIKIGLDTQAEGMQEIIAEAAAENEKLFNGEEVKPNRGATTAHLQKHLDFLQEHEDLEQEVYARIFQHEQSEVQIAIDNMTRRALSEKASQPALPGAAPGVAGAELMPKMEIGAPGMEGAAPPTIEGTAQRSQGISEALNPTQ